MTGLCILSCHRKRGLPSSRGQDDPGLSCLIGGNMPDLSLLQGLDLQVYSATWCGDCRRLDRWLGENALAHTVVDIEEVEGGRREAGNGKTGKRSIPFILVDGRPLGPGLPSRTARPLRCGAIRSGIGGGREGLSPGHAPDACVDGDEPGMARGPHPALMLTGVGAPLGTAHWAVHSRPTSGSRVRDFHPERPGRFDAELFVRELVEAGRA